MAHQRQCGRPAFALPLLAVVLFASSACAARTEADPVITEAATSPRPDPPTTATVPLVTTATSTPATTPSPVTTRPPTTPSPVTTRPPTTTTTVATTTTAAPTTVAPTTAPPTLPTIPPAPVAIAAPAIEMASALQPMGLQLDDGGVDVPSDFAVAGWYSGGGRPGAPGPTVVVGHVDSRTGPAVFYRLRDLVPGDVVEITTADGNIASYAVTSTEQFPKDQFPSFSVFGATAGDVVRRVTCTGEFNESVRSYYDNMVVTAVRIPG